MSVNTKRERSPTVLSDRDHLEKLLDEALAQSFPASDPVAVDFEAPAISSTAAGKPAAKTSRRKSR